MQLAGVGGPIVTGRDGVHDVNTNTTSIDDLDALQIQTHPVVAVKVGGNSTFIDMLIVERMHDNL